VLTKGTETSKGRVLVQIGTISGSGVNSGRQSFDRLAQVILPSGSIIERISAQQAHAKATSSQALLVCAYDDEAKCRMLNLDGSISFTSFKSRVNSLPKSQEIIFYWAWPAEASAVGQAAKYQAQGFTNVKVLKGGVEAWKAAGYAMNWSLHAAILAHQVRKSDACRLFVRSSRLDFQENADARSLP
jgi:rhodanese-related sulfurtransferase